MINSLVSVQSSSKRPGKQTYELTTSTYADQPTKGNAAHQPSKSHHNRQPNTGLLFPPATKRNQRKKERSEGYNSLMSALPRATEVAGAASFRRAGLYRAYRAFSSFILLAVAFRSFVTRVRRSGCVNVPPCCSMGAFERPSCPRLTTGGYARLWPGGLR
jgi:hypothetical protein